eukprot:403373418
MESSQTKDIFNFLEFLQNHYKTSDEIDLIEDLIEEVIEGKVQFTQQSRKGDYELMTPEESQRILEESNVYQMYKEDIGLKKLFFEELEKVKETWRMYADEPERAVYTKQEAGTNILSVYYKVKIPSSMMYPLTLLSEIDLLKEWMPSIIRSDQLESFSDFRKTLHIQREFPFPLSNREFHLCASACLVKQHKGALIMLRSMNDDRIKNWNIKNIPEASDGFVKAQMIKGFLFSEHIDENTCWFHGMMNVDPKFAIIPDWLINFTVKRLIYVIMGKLQKLKVVESDIFERRVEERKDYYERIRKRLEEIK